MAELKRVKKRKLNLKAVIILLLVIYLIVMLLYTFFTMKIKNIYIIGTNLLTDNEIIEAAEIKDYPAIFGTSKKELEEKIYKMDITELREAVMEYLLMIKDNHNFNLYAGYEQQKGSGKHE